MSFPSSERVKESPKTKTPRAVTLWRHACLTTPVVKPSPPQPPSVQPQKNSPKQKPPRAAAPEHVKESPNPPLTPRAAAPAAACVAGRSTGQHMLPQQALKTNGNSAPPHKTKNPSCRHSVAACVSDHSRGQALAPATALSPTAKEFPKTKTSSCCRSRGGMRGWPVHRPTHAPATSPQNKRQQRPPQNRKNKKRINPRRVAPAARRRRMSAPERVKESSKPKTSSCRHS